ncbi:LuxR C-terminal-related transcriptional regulator [Streptomyces sp. NPDC014861]|uniref:helix-turn-helix transcriptional regulator n=1 Tax=Streptomyces sp. NPDC014861 TaxID=3364923 RepID=UPI0036FC3F43
MAVSPVMRAVYRAALRRDGATRDELVGCVLGHDEDRWTERDASEAVDRLLSLHLLQPSDERPGQLLGRPPEVAEARALHPLRHALREMEDRLAGSVLELAGLKDVYEGATGAHAANGDLLLLSAEDVNAMLDEGAAACRTDLLTAQPGGARPVNILSEAVDRDMEMLERGVRMRTIYQHSARYSQATEGYVERIAEAGGEVRTLNTLFPRVIVFDQRVAFVPLVDGSGALRVRQPDLVAFLVSTFETAWRAAQPFASAYETRRRRVIASDMQRSIARLLMEEDKDAAIARHLGISERSCRQHISKLMTQLGARNRTHLGYLIATEMRSADASDIG